jgi:hemolysin III
VLVLVAGVPPAEAVAAAPPAEKPLLRGVLHEAAFVVSLMVAPFLLLGADTGRARFAAGIFAASVAACFGVSALYHRVTWEPSVRRWMRRLDHAGVYLLIAGTYTPVALLVLHGSLGSAVLAVVWSGAVAAILLKFVWVDAPKWLAVAIGLALGWVAVVALPQLAERLGSAPLVLLICGGLLYSAGAIVYARRKPDPLPQVFGYHEVFHGLTIAAAACQYVAIALFVVKPA